MSDDFDLENFDDFDDDENVDPALTKRKGGDDSDDDDNPLAAIREGLIRYSQRTQGGVAQIVDDGEPVDPRNDFDRLLRDDHAVELRRDDEGKEYYYLTRHHNHLAFVHHLNAVLATNNKASDLLDAFQCTLGGRNTLRLYFSQMKSTAGQQDTVWRALLLCRETQSRAFDILMTVMQKLGKEDDDESTQLGGVAVAHVRFLDAVFAPEVLFDHVFDRDIEKWHAPVRDALIMALPEIFGDTVTQNRAVVQLLTLLTDCHVRDSPSDWTMAILAALKLLRAEAEQAKKMRTILISNIPSLEARAVIEMVHVIVDGLETTGTLAPLHDTLVLLSSHLVLDKMKPTRGNKNKKTPDEVAVAVTAKLGRFVQLTGAKGWRIVSHFLRTLDSTDAATDAPDGEEGAAAKIREWRQFDVLLAVSLLGVVGCPPGIAATIRTQLTDDSRDPATFAQAFKEVYELPKFCSQHSSSLLRLARAFIWSPIVAVRQFSASIYENLLKKQDKNREEILDAMLELVGKGENEAATILDCINGLVKRNYDVIKPHADKIHDALSLLPSLSLANVRRLLQGAISICVRDQEQKVLRSDLEESSRRLVSSVSARDRTLGIVSMTMELEATLAADTPDREKSVKSLLTRLDDATKSNPQLRAVLYNEVRMLLERQPKIRESKAFLDWSVNLKTVFRANFFKERDADEEPRSSLEAEKYIRRSHTTWLDVPHTRLVELLPLFSLLKELAVLHCRWISDDDSQEAREHSFEEFMYAFEANISMCGATSVTDLDKARLTASASTYMHLVQWIRLLLNTFASRDVNPDSEIAKIKMKRFHLMFELEKTFALVVRQLTAISVPPSIIAEIHVELYDEHAKKKIAPKRKASKKSATKSKKKRGAEGDDENAQENEPPEQDEEPGSNDAHMNTDDEGNRTVSSAKGGERSTGHSPARRVPIAQLRTVFQPFEMRTVVQLLRLLSGKRQQSRYLLETLLAIVKVALPKREKKIVPWEVQHSPLDAPSASFHGEPKEIWKLATASIEPIVTLLASTSDYFRELLSSQESQQVENPDHKAQMADIQKFALGCLAEIFSSKEVSLTPPDETGRRTSKRQDLMMTVEKTIFVLRNSQERDANVSDAETTVLRFMLGIAESIPTLECAVAVLDASATLERDEEADRVLGLCTLQFMRKEWAMPDGSAVKGPPLKQAVKRLFEHYLSFRAVNERPIAILWLLRNQMTALVGDTERRRSRMDTILSPKDDFVPDDLEDVLFATLTKETFGPAYRVLFAALNATVSTLCSSRASSVKRTLGMWSNAGYAFCLLTLLLRVKHLRSATVLSSAMREGKRFLAQFSKSTGFLSLMEDEMSFRAITKECTQVLKSVQMGNRALQNIAVYAKSNRSTSLLRGIPELRAAGEGWMRAIHSALVFIGADSAFEIGLLKSRDIDGEEIHAPTRGNEDGEEGDDEDGTERSPSREVSSIRENARGDGDEEEEDGDGMEGGEEVSDEDMFDDDDGRSKSPVL